MNLIMYKGGTQILPGVNMLKKKVEVFTLLKLVVLYFKNSIRGDHHKCILGLYTRLITKSKSILNFQKP